MGWLSSTRGLSQSWVHVKEECRKVQESCYILATSYNLLLSRAFSCLNFLSMFSWLGHSSYITHAMYLLPSFSKLNMFFHLVSTLFINLGNGGLECKSQEVVVKRRIAN